jgi:hypothetical protein
MLVGLIAGRTIDRAELAFAGDSFLQMVLDLVLPKPTFRATGQEERARQGDEQQNAFHPLILGSERCNASVVAVLVSSTETK